MLMLWMRRYARPLFIPFAAATFLTLLGSILTGWHYAVDGYVGILLGQFSYWAALKLERDPEAQTAPERDGPVAADEEEE